jgi:hypothetical protein
MTTLTPKQATQVLRNGGACRMNNGDIIWLDGAFLRAIEDKGSRRLPLDLRKIEHPDYPVHVFARVYPCEMTGYEAEALIMQAPVGMLEGQYKPAVRKNVPDWGFKKDGGNFYRGGWYWSNDPFTVRLREGWLESQRGMFAAMKGEEIEEETLTGWRALKAMEEGRVLKTVAGTKVRINNDVFENYGRTGWISDFSSLTSILGCIFTVLPDAPTHIDVPLSCGLTARCEADVVKVDVPDCAVWEVTRERAELLQGLQGSTRVTVAEFARSSVNTCDAYANGDSFNVYGKKVLFSELDACIDAMDQVKGGGNG